MSNDFDRAEAFRQALVDLYWEAMNKGTTNKSFDTGEPTWEMRSHAALSHFSVDLSRLSECDAGQEDWAHGRGRHPALALAQAALRAKEAGNG